MQCNRCGKIAQKKVKGAEGEVIFLCEDCYRAVFSVPAERRQQDVCPQCGTTLSKFRSTALLGCAYCYTAFRKEILSYLDRIQVGVNHSGSRSGGNEQRFERKRELVREHDKIKAELEEAFRAGNFEKAGRLKSRLEELHRDLYPKEV